jgi:hypothetical protein
MCAECCCELESIMIVIDVNHAFTSERDTAGNGVEPDRRCKSAYYENWSTRNCSQWFGNTAITIADVVGNSCGDDGVKAIR